MALTIFDANHMDGILYILTGRRPKAEVKTIVAAKKDVVFCFAYKWFDKIRTIIMVIIAMFIEHLFQLIVTETVTLEKEKTLKWCEILEIKRLLGFSET